MKGRVRKDNSVGLKNAGRSVPNRRHGATDLECTLSAAIATFSAHPPLSTNLVTQMGGAHRTLHATIERSATVLLYADGERLEIDCRELDQTTGRTHDKAPIVGMR